MLKYSLLNLVEYYNKAIAKSAKNLLTSSLPAFKSLISSPPAVFKRFNYYYTSTSLKRQADKITL